MINNIIDEEIEEILMSNITDNWRKVARVVGSTMMHIDQDLRREIDDIYFADRLTVLVDKGLVETTGDVIEMRSTEIRLRHS